MATDFPDSPSLNDQFTVDGRIWQWNGTSWKFLGIPGPATVLSVGTVTTGDAGTDADVSLTGIAPNQTVSFTIPRGDAATVAVGAVTTGDAGTDADVVNSGTSGEAIFDFTIPQGIQGIQGIQGEQGIQGIQGIQGEPGNDGLGVPAGGTTSQVLAKVSSTDNDTEWVDAMTTGKAIAMAIVFG